MKDITHERLKAMKDPELEEAIFQPQSSRRAAKIFSFLRDNSNLTTLAGGMQHYVTGLDVDKLSRVAKGYGLNLFKYMFAVRMYENGILKAQEKNMEK